MKNSDIEMTAPDRKEPKVDESDLAARLDSTTHEMANNCSVVMSLWARHSLACRDGARRIRALERELASAPALAAEVEALRNENIALQLQWDWLIGELMDRSDTRDSGDRQGPNAEMSMLIDFDQQFPNARNAK